VILNAVELLGVSAQLNVRLVQRLIQSLGGYVPNSNNAIVTSFLFLINIKSKGIFINITSQLLAFF
jgi:hypothetical protein